MLFVDDQPLYSQALIRRLQVNCKISSDWSGSSLAALQLLNDQKFDLLVADMRLPGLPGTELLLLAAKRWPAMRRILLTGYTSGDLVIEYSEFVDRIFDKAIDAELICEAICRLARTPR